MTQIPVLFGAGLRDLVVPIESIWAFETGRYDAETKTFVDRKTRMETRTIHMRVIERSKWFKAGETHLVLEFVGGPTGFESYCFEDLVTLDHDWEYDTFCICGGTVNSWPNCVVAKSDVIDFMRLVQEKLNERA